MLIEIDVKGTVKGLQAAFEKVSDHPAIRSVLVFSCDQNGFTPQKIDPLLERMTLPVFGGIFPAIIHNTRKYETGSIVVGLPMEANVFPVHGLSAPQDYDVLLDSLVPKENTLKTMMVFVDGFSRRIGAFIDSLFNVFGLENNYLGGGAGSLSMVSKPCLFCNQGLIQDSAVLAALETTSSVGVSHGWQSIKGPFKVTQADMNTIISLDWQPAFEVYRAVVEDHARQQFSSDNFFNIAKAYPFGITKMDAERVVRDPVATDAQGGLVCVGEVPEGAFVDIMHGQKDFLIRAAGDAYRQAAAKFTNIQAGQLALFIDCISRVLFLEERFPEEIQAVAQRGQSMVGVCSIGEIANAGDSLLEFYNKTAVVGMLEIA